MKRPRLKLKAETIRELRNLDGVSGGASTQITSTLVQTYCLSKNCNVTQ